MNLFVIIGGIFVAWLMWSSKGQKESFLTLAWMSMLSIGLLHLAYLAFR